MSTLPTNPLDNNQNNPESPFEQIKRVDPDGIEFWSARDLMPLLEYASWQKFSAVCEDIYSSFCFENTSQTEMIRSTCEVEIGYGAIRKVEDWHLTRSALEQLLNRAASHKPHIVRALRKFNETRFRIEIEIGATLFDFCEAAGLSITHQKRIGPYVFDYCIADELLIEIDEGSHRFNSAQRDTDRRKYIVAARKNYKLLRVAIPVNNAVHICGQITRLLLKRMSMTDFATNMFFITQAEDKLLRDNVQGKNNANQVHYEAGLVVRRAIQELGGTMPEDLPTADSIKKLEQNEKKRLKSGKLDNSEV